MMILIVGGSGSGKSAYAEKRVGEFPGKKYYLATMQISDEESRRKADRHRELRKDKDFITIEQPVEIQKALAQMAPGEKTVLLECMSNLTANEMFSGEKPQTKEQVVESVIAGIKILQKEITHLVIVSNNVFEDGIIYDETTMEYIEAMGAVNEKLAAIAEQVVEVMTGMPVMLKH
ncbi:MAG: bifunctional adenosylcobinamide kinase/adenosylcobinamide-phosphate guanylyltransferase [Bacillus sp. (in: Bacteria)]|nr:bifunctional adenosylcobinamide kinase/adenosylcobinamide-phosphate guanylyltransferase [Bacillus sp. (in: firmicutes)]MCM1427458.1 bifunctional adenosylcobinamide kinase/adenosylcobinamide-phosphate guanylyltransferase [Eubacterium sp.]